MLCIKGGARPTVLVDGFEEGPEGGIDVRGRRGRQSRVRLGHAALARWGTVALAPRRGRLEAVVWEGRRGRVSVAWGRLLGRQATPRLAGAILQPAAAAAILSGVWGRHGRLWFVAAVFLGMVPLGHL